MKSKNLVHILVAMLLIIAMLPICNMSTATVAGSPIEYTPPLYANWYVQEDYHTGDRDIPMVLMTTFFQSNIEMTANQMGLYFRDYMYEGDKLVISSDVYVCEPSDPTNPNPMSYKNPVLVATDVPLSNILSGNVGWKWFAIDNFTFQKDKLYVIKFDVRMVPVVNGQVDRIITASRTKLTNTTWESFQQYEPGCGGVYREPLAIGAMYEEIVEPPLEPPFYEQVYFGLPFIVWAVGGVSIALVCYAFRKEFGLVRG